MNLRVATLAAMLGVCAVFVLRTAATFSTRLFTSPVIAQTAVWIHLLSAAALLWFFLAFWKEMAGPERAALQQASGLAAAGAALAFLVPLQTLLRISDIAPFSAFVRSPWLEPSAPLIASVAILIFFAVCRRDLSRPEEVRLRVAANVAMWAYALFTVLNLVVLALYLSSGELRWLTQRGPLVAWLTLPVVGAGLIAVLYFFLTLWKHLDPRRQNAVS